ncbi:L-seryl-tRNA(Sec) selenium transferase [Ursidibacter maritimus]|uniref:L-seryl-tRNA(Sec) selenium transferase n=1 Tax=Ursidibacter maritimus TaxID=1331689 RepID=A0A949T828_9PAST|nr:L-seryl-tRNA(Sec) selenium transferase [Ursidibacter maritimus]KAE9540119.1 L-seryl-tRNA(Sec) selenium transferase [Ursidibacter maritimus]MBV6524369.1 L-seryl-tRNA(Sec) selenium transferase [Ursidibacter maritimus]MBV6526565.1 L-seryl-tRNA(Sec) selenium transferase [Ursidibacter maritimus]MBV6527812.1 L-seryl-tRNA(Sec) selenium transferase [Ursidibacter maritimus]MBV6530121.1 L-seryl-tRNA(Sec) selenium transferase [Ursidibacter maritimus]
MQHLFRSIPALDKLLKTVQGQQLILQFGHQAVVEQIRSLLAQIRQEIHQTHALPDICQSNEFLLNRVEELLSKKKNVAIKQVFNLTGTVLHTNLGRGLWSENAIQAATQAMKHNVALEFDIEAGKRSHRDHYISQLLSEITGAEAACIVNNNAAAVLLILATFAQGKEVIISRGELIEIGGSFRIPDIMQQAGCKLVEVGTTNRTHLKDYRNAITENTAFLMKVHTSNYQIQGFTANVSEEELVALGKEFNLPVMSDLGSGSLVNMQALNLPAEPMVQDKVLSGVDLISFSGDKLLGGPQAGIIVGKKSLISQLQQHPLKRVLRCDKVILSGLEATLRQYLFPEQLTHSLPTLQLLTQKLDELNQKAEQLKASLYKQLDSRYILQIEPSLAQIGSGALPTEQIPSIAVTISSANQRDLLELEQQFKNYPNPMITRISQQKMWLDLRSVGQFDELLEMLNEN